MFAQRILAFGLFSTLMISAMSLHTGLDTLGAFFDLPALLVVLGCLIAGTLYAFPIQQVFQAFRMAYSKSTVSSESALLSHTILLKMADYAIASGVIGTFIGVVKMLGNMSDPTALGPAMAVAILTLFYGVILSEIIFKSLANGLLVQHNLLQQVSRNRGFSSVYLAVWINVVVLMCYGVILQSL